MSNWFSSLSGAERRTFWACFGGWGLDAMDTQMYALSIPILVALWGMSKSQAGLLGTVVLVMAAVGGWVGGVLADRCGRVRILRITILWFAAFTFLAAFTNSFWSLMGARSLQGLGFGAEWAVGSALISESIRPDVRGRAVGAIQAGWAVGYGLAVVLSTVLFSVLAPALAWRVLFAMGATPALLVFWIRRNVRDAPMHVEQRASRAPRSDRPYGNFLEIFDASHLGVTVRAALLTIGIYGGNYVLITWLPAYLRLERHQSILNTGATLAVNIAGSFCGAFVNGWLADGVGRRRTFMLIAVCQIAVVATYTMANIGALVSVVLAFFLGLLQSGTAAGTSAFIAELFPTRIRAGALGFCGNSGRAFGAVLPTVVGILSVSTSLGVAMGLCACGAYALVIMAAFLLPETRGRNLQLIEPT